MLHFDFETNSVWVEPTKATEEELAAAHANAVELPKDVRVMDVWSRGKGKTAVGQTAIRITEKGYLEPSVMRIAV